MTIKTYKARTAAEALRLVKDELGPDAIILHTRTTKGGGVMGIGAHTIVEITATTQDDFARSRTNANTPTHAAPKRPGGAGSVGSTRSAGSTESAASRNGTEPRAGASQREATPRVAARYTGPKPGAPIGHAHEPAQHADERAAPRDQSFKELADHHSTDRTASHDPRASHEPPAPGDRTHGFRAPVRSAALDDPFEDTTLRPSHDEPLPRASIGGRRSTTASREQHTSDFDDRAHANHTGLSGELASIRRMVGEVLRTQSGTALTGLPEPLAEWHRHLLEQDLCAQLAADVISAARERTDRADLSDRDAVKRAVHLALMDVVPVCTNPPAIARQTDGRPHTMALIGPTGVGKTTTIAKLAANYKLRKGKRVGLVTCDTYRIAAVDQLRTYASIIGVDLRVAMSPGELADITEDLAPNDVILIDTAGRAPTDHTRLSELGAYLDAARPHRTHLLMSAASSERTMRRTLERFGVFSPQHIVFSKLDEAVTLGPVINVASDAARPQGDPEALFTDAPPAISLSFMTTGQEVPDDIQAASADRVARRVLDAPPIEAQLPAAAGALR